MKTEVSGEITTPFAHSYRKKKPFREPSRRWRGGGERESEGGGGGVGEAYEVG